jgi:hypothetical protein
MYVFQHLKDVILDSILLMVFVNNVILIVRHVQDRAFNVQLANPQHIYHLHLLVLQTAHLLHSLATKLVHVILVLQIALNVIQKMIV